MKLRMEIEPGVKPEIIIRADGMTDEVKRLQAAIETVLYASELLLNIGESDYFVPTNQILFFEAADGRITAHTQDRMYSSQEKLYTLERSLPRQFVRVSKSCIVNSIKVESIMRGVTGTAEAHFYGTQKKAYISRMYYKVLKEMIYETRLRK